MPERATNGNGTGEADDPDARESSDDRPRAARMRERFVREFGGAGRLRRVRAPGRVNLIGEHIDYNDLPVLPMALQLDTSILFRARDDARVRLVNLDARFAPREFELSRSIEPFESGDWGNYAKAAAQILAEECAAARGLDAVVSGNVPPAGGLSSSAALVVGVGLALSLANELELAPLELAERMARGERYVGTQGGGMDQAICVLGARDVAVQIEFAPLRATRHPVPSDWRFVIANSMVVADKSGSAREAYNSRRASCAAALARVARELGAPTASYRELVATCARERLLEVASRVLAPVEARRFRHVVSENERVALAVQALEHADRMEFGRCMNASHESLARDYEVSVPELDELVRLARDARADGARLTGAGFGGSIVALCRDSAADELARALAEGFYRPRGKAPEVFVARASEGAREVD